jgi:tRNA(adenine34) deaminase
MKTGIINSNDSITEPVMDLKMKENLVLLAMQEAQLAADEGNYPFGALVADAEGNVIAKAHNTQNTDSDPTAHAEINLIRLLAKTYSETDFADFYLVSNAESCSMCLSAAIKTGFVHYVFGAPSEAHMEPYLTVSEMLKYCRKELDVTFGVLEDKCRTQISDIRKKQGKLAQ